MMHRFNGSRTLLHSLAVLAAIGTATELWAVPVPPRQILSQPWGPNTRIRVRLSESVASAKIRGFDLAIFEGGAPPSPSIERSPAGARPSPGVGAAFGSNGGNVFARLAGRLDRLSEWEIHCARGRVRATGLGVSGKPLTLELQEPVAITTPAGFLSYKGQPYREEIRIHTVGSRCEIINVVDVEKYLDGLVNAEFSARWNEEAIGAQVVAARTYAYHQIMRSRQSHFDVDATVKDQVYDGSMREDFRASRAVEKTAGWVLTTGPNYGATPIKAFYHSTCGGVTQLPEHVWGAPYPGFTRSVRCGFCNASPTFAWRAEFTGQDIAQSFLSRLRSDGPLPGWPRGLEQVFSRGRLIEVKPSRVDPQGRVKQLRLLWSSGPRIVPLFISSARFRDWMGPARFRSASFVISPLPAAYVPRWRFEGRGYGHGVGLCQYGAKGMGEKGYKMAAILQHYYPGAVLRKLW